MKNTIITSDTIKLINEPFAKNSKGSYPSKNAMLLDYAKKSLKLKLGENLVINFCHASKVRLAKASDNELIEYNSNSDLLKVAELVNFFDNFSLCFEDRIFRIAQNDKGNFLLYCLSMKNQFATIYVKDKNCIAKHNETVRDPLTNEVYSVEVVKGKGKRVIENSDISTIKTVFNTMLGVNFNKPLVEVVKKSA